MKRLQEANPKYVFNKYTHNRKHTDGKGRQFFLEGEIFSSDCYFAFLPCLVLASRIAVAVFALLKETENKKLCPSVLNGKQLFYIGWIFLSVSHWSRQLSLVLSTDRLRVISSQRLYCSHLVY